MSTNKVYEDGKMLRVACSYPSAPAAGDPVLLGTMTGVAETDEDADGLTCVDFGQGVWDLEVVDTGGGGIAVGDVLFLNAAATLLNDVSSGTFFGYALEAITAGQTETIRVLHVPSPGSGTLGSGTVGSVNLAANAVIATKIAEDTTVIVVSAGGSDTTGDGSWTFPFKTIAKAVTLWTAARHTIIVLPGAYAEAAPITWPSISGLSLVALGSVTITDASAGDQVINIAPTYTDASFEAFIRGDITVDHGAKIGLHLANAAMTKKLIVSIDGLVCEEGGGDSIAIDGTVAGQAIRVYANGIDCEGLVHFTANDAGSRLRTRNSNLGGGVDTTGAVAAELSLRGTQVLTGGLAAVDSTWVVTTIGCNYCTDAGVVTKLDDAYSA